MSRAPHEPTNKTINEVKALASFGVPQEKIATYIGIDPKTLRLYYRETLDNSATQANAAVGKFLYKAASGQALNDGASYSDCVRSAMFWLKTRANWREKQELDHSSSDGSMSPANSEDTAQTVINKLQNKHSS